MKGQRCPRSRSSAEIGISQGEAFQIRRLLREVAHRCERLAGSTVPRGGVRATPDTSDARDCIAPGSKFHWAKVFSDAVRP